MQDTYLHQMTYLSTEPSDTFNCLIWSSTTMINHLGNSVLSLDKKGVDCEEEDRRGADEDSQGTDKNQRGSAE